MKKLSTSTICTQRNNCRLCESKDVNLAIPFKPTALAEKYVRSIPHPKQPLFPVDLYMCGDCGHVQILNVIDPEYLWSDYTYHSGQTQGIIDHFSEVSQHIIKNHQHPDNNFVIDVGSNDGSLLRFFKNENFRVLGIDPAVDIAKKASENGLETIAALMSESLGKKLSKRYGKAGIVTAFNVFAHADEMIDLVKGIKEILAKDGVFVFEVSYLKDIIQKMLIGTIFHEHLCNHSLRPMKLFLENHGLEIFDVEHVSIQGGSLIGFVQHKGSVNNISSRVTEMLADEDSFELQEMSTMETFVRRFTEQQIAVNRIVSQYADLEGIFAGYGAARSGPMLINQFNLNSIITTIFDDHPQKLGMLTPGDYIPVVKTSEIDQIKPKLTFVLAWIHAKKIIQKHQDYLDGGGVFVLLTPEVEIITKENFRDFR